MTRPIRGAEPDRAVEGEVDRRARWPFLVVLGAPALGTTFAITALSTYLPSLLGRESGPLVTGLVIGGEGPLKQALIRQAGMARLTGHVSFTGFIGEDEGGAGYFTVNVPLL